MMRRLFVAALLAAPMASQAADPPPRAEAKPDIPGARFIWESEVQIIQIKVRQSQPPPSERGDCVVSGVVQAVWQGDAYRPGADVILRVPCNSAPWLQRGDKYDSTSGAVDPRLVMQATSACVHIRRSGQLFWSVGDRRPGPCNNTTGYTPLDPPPVRLRPPRAL